MRTLFLKIFLSFWLTIVLMGVPFYFLALKNRPEHFSPGMADFEMQAMAHYGDEALAAWDAGGQDGLRAFLETIEQQSGIRLYLFAGTMAVPSDRPVPAKARTKADQIINGAPLKPPGFPPEEKWLGRRLTTQTGQSEAPDILVLQLPIPPLPPPLLTILPPMRSGPWNNILLYSLVGGLVCYFLARSLTAPIRKLREASNRIAHGDFSVRVSPELGHSGREVADLGRDFDTMAERIEELLLSKKQLLRDISHELRSPLARLNVALELARQRSGEDAKQPLERIERESGRLNELIGELLTLTRLENGVQDLERVEFSLNELMELIVADALYEARHHHRHVRITEAEPIMLHGSRELMRRALENVVRNAVRYTQENSTVEITLIKTGSTEGKQATIVIRDHGPGVPDAAFEHLFEPFYRVDNARDRQSGGTGLGLAIAEQAVRLHHGTITAANADQGGLIMTIRLPIREDHQEEDRPLSPTRSAS
ncbi:MAG: HAMP domain-containing protein [Desulfobulbaceae bacterium]|nr:HAMP domain-containing protein [Desulfobulbaceae bacterium]